VSLYFVVLKIKTNSARLNLTRNKVQRGNLSINELNLSFNFNHKIYFSAALEKVDEFARNSDMQTEIKI
jgi:hypothetical protein